MSFLINPYDFNTLVQEMTVAEVAVFSIFGPQTDGITAASLEVFAIFGPVSSAVTVSALEFYTIVEV